jgi:hypothetical protein
MQKYWVNCLQAKDNDGLMIRISNAAASELQVMETKFPVELSWVK